MAQTLKKAPPLDAWESGKLGREEKYVERADSAAEKALDEALGLLMISVRLQKSLIADLKFIARHNGIGYQPLIRDILTRFATKEKMGILRQKLEQTRLEEAAQATSDAAKEAPPRRRRAA